jgi:hypothetical protein
MATKQENADIAVLQDNMKEVKKTLERIEGKLDGLDAKYALKEDVKKLKWQTIPLTIIMSSVLTALVYYFISHVGGTQ